MKSAADVITTDLDQLTSQLADEFPKLSGRRVMIAGGAGFLGYYLVQAPLFSNRRNPSAAAIQVTVLDNFIRGDMRLLDAVIHINEEQPRQVIQLLLKHRASLQGVRVTVLGLSFKPGTNDTRESPAFPIIRELLSREASVAAFDPAASHEARHDRRAQQPAPRERRLLRVPPSDLRLHRGEQRAGRWSLLATYLRAPTARVPVRRVLEGDGHLQGQAAVRCAAPARRSAVGSLAIRTARG